MYSYNMMEIAFYTCQRTFEDILRHRERGLGLRLYCLRLRLNGIRKH